MTTAAYHFHRVGPALPTADEWRALDRAVARWVIAHGGSVLLAEVAAWASVAEGHGDSALPLAGADAGRHGMRILDPRELASLQAESLVGAADARSGDIDTPFVIDAGRFYLRRNFLHEVAVAERIAARRSMRPAADAASPAAVDALFHADASAHVQPQREAVARVCGRRLFVLTGGPGSGKTTTVLRMLLMLLAQGAASAARAPVVRLAAPTGKAAQRLSESLRDGAKRLREHPQQPLAAEWSVHIDHALAAQAGTLHRLLGSQGQGGGFRHHRDNPLPADIVVVDEASMVDLGMLRALLDALHEDTVLILVGVAEQLTWVGSCSVLLDLVGAMEAQAADDIVRLRHSFRADQTLVPINEAIRAGDRRAFDAAWLAAGERVQRHEVTTGDALRRALGRWQRELHRLLQRAGALRRGAGESAEAVPALLAALRERQLLCALREGEFGADAVNAAIERALGADVDGHAGATWYPGRVVMITRNDETSGLFNGDIGLCLSDRDGRLGVWFETSRRRDLPASENAGDDAMTRRAIRFDLASLPEHRGAFAVTVHKSQGSEYGHVAVLLPPDPTNRILSRQLLYTAVSRARGGIELWGSDAALDAAINTPVRRAGGLIGRLARPSP